jgi:nucleotide-binding universal stress UspA family protein
VVPIIVVGVDGSADSAAALDVARALAPCLGGDVLAVHVRDQRLTAAECDCIEESIAGEYSVEVGNPPAVLLGFATRANAGLLAVGARGNTVLESLLLGSVAEYAVHHGPVPVLVVRHRPA